MYNYTAFGLDISSELEFNELSLCENTSELPDLVFRLVDLGCEIPPIGSPAIFDFDDDLKCQMTWPGILSARISGPDLVEVQVYPEVSRRLVPFALLGPVLGWVLHLRGLLVLHASAITWHGKTIALIGDKGAGKSTTATAFLRAGARLLTDDLLAIDLANFNRPTCLPAYAQIKLVKETSEQVRPPGSNPLPLVWDDFPKRQYRLGEMQQTPMPCDYVFVLNRTEHDLSLEWLKGIDAVASLMRFTYNTRFTDAPARLQKPDQRLKNCASIALSARVGRFHVPHDLDQLDEAIRFVGDTISLKE